MFKKFPGSLFFDTLCSHCHAREVDQNGFLCSVCLNSLYPKPLRYFEFEFLDGVFSFAPYEGVGKTYLHLIKFQGAKNLIPFLGKLVKPTLRKVIEEIKPDLVSFVPTHPFRVWFTRGFDQVEELIKGTYPNYVQLFERGLIPKKPLYLVGSKFNRKKHLKGSYKLKPEMAKLVEGKKVLLIDDLITTGSTGNTLAYLLKSVGADSVYLFTVFYKIKAANVG